MGALHIERVPATYSAGLLLRVWRWLREDPEGRAVQPDLWTFPEPMRFAEFRRWFLECLQAKINRDAPPRAWRKLEPDWYWEAFRTARAVNTPRLRVHATAVPLEFRERLRHRLTWPGEE